MATPVDQTSTDDTELKWAAKRTTAVWETGYEDFFLLSFELGFPNDGQVFCMNCGGRPGGRQTGG